MASALAERDEPVRIHVSRGPGDRVYRAVARGAGAVTLILMALIGTFLVLRAWPALWPGLTTAQLDASSALPWLLRERAGRATPGWNEPSTVSVLGSAPLAMSVESAAASLASSAATTGGTARIRTDKISKTAAHRLVVLAS